MGYGVKILLYSADESLTVVHVGRRLGRLFLHTAAAPAEGISESASRATDRRRRFGNVDEIPIVLLLSAAGFGRGRRRCHLVCHLCGASAGTKEAERAASGCRGLVPSSWESNRSTRIVLTRRLAREETDHCRLNLGSLDVDVYLISISRQPKERNRRRGRCRFGERAFRLMRRRLLLATV